MNERLGKDFYRKGNSAKRLGPFSSVNRRTLKLKSCCPHPLPENQLLFKVKSPQSQEINMTFVLKMALKNY